MLRHSIRQSPRSDLPRWALARLLRWRYVVLCAWLAVWAARKPFVGADWHWFTLGTELLFRGSPGGGLHTFATDARLHMGPVSLVPAAAARVAFPGDGRVVVAFLLLALGPLVVYAVERVAASARGLANPLDDHRLALVTLVSGAACLYSWTDVAFHYGRLDEVIVICAAAAALWFVFRGQPLAAGAAIGIAIGAKAWAILLVPLLAGLPWRQALRSGALAAALAAAAWLPFFVADLGTLDSVRAGEAVRVFHGSGAHVFGIDLGLVPDWLRPLQAAVALALATLAVVGRRWTAAILVAVGARLLLDPAPITYYATALVFAALVWDSLGGRRPFPVWAPVIVLAYYAVPQAVDNADAAGVVRVSVTLAAIVAVLAAPGEWLRRPSRPTEA